MSMPRPTGCRRDRPWSSPTGGCVDSPGLSAIPRRRRRSSRADAASDSGAHRERSAPGRSAFTRTPRSAARRRADATLAATVAVSFEGLVAQQLVDVWSVDSDGNVEAIEQRSRDPPGISGSGPLAAPTGAGKPSFSAGARVHGRHQDEPCWVLDRPSGSADSDHALLERLPEDIEHDSWKLAELVQEQHATMSQADLAGPQRGAAAPDHGYGRRPVVGSPERWAHDQPSVTHRQGRSRADATDLGGPVMVEFGEQAGQPLGQHGLSRSRRSDQQEMVTSRRGHLEARAGRPADHGRRPGRERTRRSGPGRIGRILGHIVDRHRWPGLPRRAAGPRVRPGWMPIAGRLCSPSPLRRRPRPAPPC